MSWLTPALGMALSGLGLALGGALLMLLVLMVLVPMKITADLEVEREILANFRIQWLLAGRAWHRRWDLADLLQGDRRPAMPRPGGLRDAARAMGSLWPRVRRRLRWRAVAVDLVVGPADEPHLAAVAAGWLWGVVPSLLAWLGIPPRTVRLGIRPARGAEPARGRLHLTVGLRPVHGLLLVWQAYRLLRRRRGQAAAV
ncbi:MAG: hypothetical protein DIU70_008815 [Bacillota bacterium]